MYRVLSLALFFAPLAVGCAGQAEGEACNPYPRTGVTLRGCQEDLVCVGTRDEGRCARADAPRIYHAQPARSPGESPPTLIAVGGPP